MKMIRKEKNLFYIIFVFLFFCFFVPSSVYSKDAIGVRVMKNPKHLSPALWYFENVPNPGSPKSMIIDNYEAIRDGRSIYIAASNSNDAGNLIYTNIYIISYSEGAKEATKKIFNEILRNFHFNTNANSLGKCGCMNAGTCPNGESLYCSSNFDCYVENTNYGPCDIQKDKFRRDTKRLADLRDIEYKLVEHLEEKASYPSLLQGSYVAGNSNSKWSSWDEVLARQIDKKLPADPLNRFWGDCQPPINTDGYNPNTCWNEVIRDFDCPNGSHFYEYASKGVCSIDCNTPCVRDSDCPGFENGEYCLSAITAELSTNLEYKNISWVGDTSIGIPNIAIGNADYCGNLIFPPLTPAESFNCCIPLDCSEVGYECGTYTNACNQTIVCGGRCVGGANNGNHCSSPVDCPDGTCQSQCPSGAECIEGVCCTRNCAGKECGDDGCGGSCGDCSATEFCDIDFQCKSDCVNDCDEENEIFCSPGNPGEVTVCGYYDDDYCLDWSVNPVRCYEVCSSDKVCYGGPRDGSFCTINSDCAAGGVCGNCYECPVEVCNDLTDNDCDGLTDNCCIFDFTFPCLMQDVYKCEDINGNIVNCPGGP